MRVGRGGEGRSRLKRRQQTVLFALSPSLLKTEIQSATKTEFQSVELHAARRRNGNYFCVKHKRLAVGKNPSINRGHIKE